MAIGQAANRQERGETMVLTIRCSPETKEKFRQLALSREYSQPLYFDKLVNTVYKKAKEAGRIRVKKKHTSKNTRIKFKS